MHAIPHANKKSDTKFRSASPLATWVSITQLNFFEAYFLLMRWSTELMPINVLVYSLFNPILVLILLSNALREKNQEEK